MTKNRNESTYFCLKITFFRILYARSRTILLLSLVQPGISRSNVRMHNWITHFPILFNLEITYFTQECFPSVNNKCCVDQFLALQWKCSPFLHGHLCEKLFSASPVIALSIVITFLGRFFLIPRYYIGSRQTFVLSYCRPGRKMVLETNVFFTLSKSVEI